MEACLPRRRSESGFWLRKRMPQADAANASGATFDCGERIIAGSPRCCGWMRRARGCVRQGLQIRSVVRGTMFPCSAERARRKRFCCSRWDRRGTVGLGFCHAPSRHHGWTLIANANAAAINPPGVRQRRNGIDHQRTASVARASVGAAAATGQSAADATRTAPPPPSRRWRSRRPHRCRPAAVAMVRHPTRGRSPKAHRE